MTVTEQFWSYGFMAYIAENGGFVGLFLGYSLLQLEELITFCSQKFQSEPDKEELRNNSAVSRVAPADEAQIEKEVFDFVFNLEKTEYISDTKEVPTVDLEKTARDISHKKRKRKNEKK